MTHELWRDTLAAAYGHGSDGRAEPWAGLKQVILVRITHEFLERPEKPRAVEDHYYLSSIPPTSALITVAALLELLRGHWGIENGLHHKKDRSMREDDQRRTLGACMFSWLRSLAVGLHRFIDGASTTEKETTIQADLPGAVALLRRIRFPKNGRLLL